MTYGFLETYVDTRSSNGIDDTFLSELHYRDTDGTLYKIPKNATTNGGDIPWCIQWIPGFEPMGKHWFDYAMHDAGYRGTLQVLRGHDYVPANLTRQQCDSLLKRSVARKDPVRSHLVYAGVRAGGWKHYRKP